MSKENNNLRLLGSPVNLTYRSKKKEDRKNTRNRPRSALQNSTCSDYQERFRRPYSADTKDRAPSRSFSKTFSSELLYDNPPITIKVLSPTQELLNNRQQQSKDICSNASDFGSEDTFMSLGTKIKAKAQSGLKSKTQHAKSYLKYRNIAKRGRKMEADSENATSNDYELDIRISEKFVRSPSPPHQSYSEFRTSSPTFKYRNHQLRFASFGDSTIEEINDSFNFATSNPRCIELPLTKQHLSLVEEESNQDLESLPSQDRKTAGTSVESQERNVDRKDGSNSKSIKDKDYDMFYEKFNEFHTNTYKTELSDVAIDASSKDSGYPDSVNKDEKRLAQSLSLPNATMLKKTTDDSNVPQSFDYIKKVKNKDDSDFNNKHFTDVVNHSRLLYKDFFLKKEGHIAIPPNNSPERSVENALDINESTNPENENTNLEYPSYLTNSSTKAYTSKVIEDYKKEIEAINNLHELTLKDIKTDAISPTPFDIDNMFEQYSNNLSDEIKDYSRSQESSNSSQTSKDKNCNKNKQDVSKVTSKELIQNYLKIKDDFKGIDKLPKTLKKYDKKFSNISSKYLEGRTQKHVNKDTVKNSEKTNIRSQRNPFTVTTPLSARLDELQNNKDVESWISLSAPSPRVEDDKSSGETEVKSQSPEDKVDTSSPIDSEESKPREPTQKSNVLDIYSMLKEIESYGDKPVEIEEIAPPQEEKKEERCATPKDNFMEIFEFLEKVEQSATDALSVVTNTTPQSIPKLEALLRLPQTELAQRLVTAALQLDERSCCIALLQESLASHKQQMITKVNNLEKQSHKHVARVKQECEDTIKRHQTFIDQLINDKKTLNHRIEQLVDERRTLEERWRRSAQALEERYRLQLRTQHDKMAAAHQVARQRWVKQKAEKIKELTIKGLESELREMADRQQKEVADLKMAHAEQNGRLCAKHAQELDELRAQLEDEKQAALVRERQMASARMEKQIVELETSYQQQRGRLVAELRADGERAAADLAQRERAARADTEKWKEEQECLLEEKRKKLEQELAQEKENFEEQLDKKRKELEVEFESYKKEYEAQQRMILKKRETEIAAQHKLERDREIEKAIESLEAEAQAGRRELQEALRRNKEQYETELQELGETEKATLRRYQDAQARVRHAEDRCAELELSVGQLETRNKILTEKNSQLEAQVVEARATAEEEWRGRLRARETEMEEARKTHDEQMHQLYAKVKVAVARKDSAIQALTRETAKLQEKATLLEQKLAQQRKDFLKAK